MTLPVLQRRMNLFQLPNPGGGVPAPGTGLGGLTGFASLVGSEDSVLGAAAPLAIIGGLFSLISTILGLISTLITIIKFIIAYTIFFIIVIVIGLNLFNLVGGFDFFLWVSRRLLNSQDCVPLVPP